MTSAERDCPPPGESLPLTPEQIENIPSRLVGMMTALHQVYGPLGGEPDQDPVSEGKAMLRDLFVDLGVDISQYGHGIEDPDWTFPDLSDYAALPVAAVAVTDKLTPDQKIDIFSKYPEIIRLTGFAFNQGGGRAQVIDKLSAMISVEPDSKEHYQLLVKDTEKRWRADSRDRIRAALGRLVRRKTPTLADTQN
jgi:hypothetical protein